MSSPFHAGEHAVQARLGVRGVDAWARKVVRDHLPEQHRAFHTSLPFVVAAARDGQGRAWVTLLCGREGFVTSPDERTLVIDARPAPGDALEHAFGDGEDLGLLGIELATRRRNRVNGRVDGEGAAIVLRVQQSFGNCPQHIHARAWRRVDGAERGPPVRTARLSATQRAWIRGADTFFTASGYRGEGESPAYGMDASHRGGEPGFVEVVDERCIVFPDYAGNNHFNTIGNLALDPRIGLTFVDFATGSLLQLTGRATIEWDAEAVARVPGARRLVRVDIDAVVELPRAIELRWESEAGSVRSLRVVEKIRESEDVTSFVLAARDGGDLPDFEAGQHLPVEIAIAGQARPAARTYSLSSGPGVRSYRISVKRESGGLVSRALHDEVEAGAVLDARRPVGDFLLEPGDHPAVLVSAGVGLTPTVSMLHVLSDRARRAPAWFIHGARDGAHHPLRDEVAALARRRPGIAVHVAYSQPRPGDRGHDSVGRIDGALISRLVDAPHAHYYLCGPSAFMAAIQSDLEARGVPAARIHSESFGAAAA